MKEFKTYMRERERDGETERYVWTLYFMPGSFPSVSMCRNGWRADRKALVVSGRGSAV